VPESAKKTPPMRAIGGGRGRRNGKGWYTLGVITPWGKGRGGKLLGCDRRGEFNLRIGPYIIWEINEGEKKRKKNKEETD